MLLTVVFLHRTHMYHSLYYVPLAALCNEFGGHAVKKIKWQKDKTV